MDCIEFRECHRHPCPFVPLLLVDEILDYRHIQTQWVHQKRIYLMSMRVSNLRAFLKRIKSSFRG